MDTLLHDFPAQTAQPLCLDSAPGSGLFTAKKWFLTRQIISETIKIFDFVVIAAAAFAAYAAYIVHLGGSASDMDRYGLTSVVGASIFVVWFKMVGGYRFERLLSMRWQLLHIAGVWLASILFLALFAYITDVSDTYSRGWTLAWAAIAIGALSVERALLRGALSRWNEQGYLSRRVAIVGSGEIGEQLLMRLESAHDNSIRVVGVFDDRKTRVMPSVAGHLVLGTTDDLLHFARTTHVDEIILALPITAERRLEQLLDKLRMLPVDLRVSAPLSGPAALVRGLSYVNGVPVLDIIERPLKEWSAVAKWVEDKVFGAMLLALFAPLMIMIAILIKLDSRGPVFFSQKRFGFNNRAINVLKFRTMYVQACDPSGSQRTVRTDPRVTRVGRYLRRLSLDELPQLLNVMRGDMSLVGPRAHALHMKVGERLYHETLGEYLHRHRVKPGITGWAQVHGLRGEVDTLEKASQRLKYDLEYIEKWSIWLDLKILLSSAPALLGNEQAY